ncbi:beta-ketoacyl-ACP synthase 3 [Streptomyces sp. NPDC049577]|uniref:beta-ketoacyl-ACP synthase 3 n=1 Tax=Streptomyces sp. NPDC049577 TaxID=3155153 RepID=UPI003412016F
MTPTPVIHGIGICLPQTVLSNDDVIRRGQLDVNDEWIRTRTGITTRRQAPPGIATGDLALGAARAALASAGTTGTDLVLLATNTPDHPCPATAPRIAHRLGADGVPAFDLAATCSGFLYGLATACAFLRSGLYGTVLLIAAETYSRIVDPCDRNTAAVFGDGAAAVTLRPGDPDEPGAVLTTELGADGSGSDLITIKAGGSALPAHSRPLTRDQQYIRMRGPQVYRHAVRRMHQCASTTLDTVGWPLETVEAFIGHQANQRILDAVADRLGIAPRHRHGNIRDIGNTGAASIPLAMAATATAGSLQPGARTLLTTFGGGLTWGAAALTWPAATPVSHPHPAPPTTTHQQETPGCTRSSSSPTY